MNWRNVWIIFRKELLDTLRDRKTLMVMVLLPIAVIPAMMFIMNKFVESGVKRLTEDASIVAVVGRENGPSFVTLLERLGEVGRDPAALAGVDEPLLTEGLNRLMSPDELLDAMLLSGAIEELPEDEKDRLGSARFIEAIDYTPSAPELADSFGANVPDFFGDARELRLVSSARALRELGDLDTTELLKRGHQLVADRQRLEGMRTEQREEIDARVEVLDVVSAELSAAAQAGDYHAILVLHDGFLESLRGEGTARYSVLYDESREKSAAARRKLDRFVDRLQQGVVRARVDVRALQGTLLEPFDGAELNLGRARSPLAFLLPYMVLLMCFLGAIYPAIDLGAGEKERGTLETLLVTPAERLEFVLGKFAMVSLAGMVATVLSVSSLVLSAKAGLLPSIAAGGLVLDPTAVVVSVVLMLPVAALFAAVLLATSIYAKSFKEAQSYATPINLAILIPALASFVPGIELTIPLSFVPLVNVSLALKEAWAGIFKWDCLAVILASSMVYAGAALAFCTKWFQREEVLFRS